MKKLTQWLRFAPNKSMSGSLDEGLIRRTKQTRKSGREAFANFEVLETRQMLSITIDSANSVSVQENTGGTFFIVTATPDNGPGVTFSLDTGGDNDFFSIDSSGNLAFQPYALKDFETPEDAGANNVYNLVITASDDFDESFTTQAFSVTVTDVNDNAPEITSADAPDAIDEGTTVVVTLTATDVDTVGSPSWSVTGGAQASYFFVNGGNALEFVAPADYEDLSSYEVQVRAFDGVNETLQTITVSLNDVNDHAPVITSSANPPAIDEGNTVVVALTATDVDTVGSLSWSVTGGAQASYFFVNGGDELEFFDPSDFEDRSSYQVQVRAFDGVNEAFQTLSSPW